MNFLLITLRATGTGMLVNYVLTSKDTRVSSDTNFCSLRDTDKPLLSLTNEKLFTQYC